MKKPVYILIGLAILMLTGLFYNAKTNTSFDTNTVADKASTSKMTASELVTTLKELANPTDSLSYKNEQMVFSYNNVELVLLTSIAHDRMRIITPITPSNLLTPEQIENTMNANFHSALDARYAVNNGILYSAYIHPLSSLNKEQIKLAVQQVSTLALTFGTSYTSGGLTFGKQQRRNTAEDSNKKSI